MGSLELNKAAAAVLLAGIAFVGSGLLGKALVGPSIPEKAHIAVAEPQAAATAPEAAPEPPISVLLASASPQSGESQVKAQGCVACHTFNKGGKAGVGPNLYGVVGAPHGHMEGYQYTAALKGKAGPWTFDELNDWIKKPSAYAPGTKMSYPGLADPKKRADIIEYLRTDSDNPEAKPAPTADETAAAQKPAAAAAGAPAAAPKPAAAAAPAPTNAARPAGSAAGR